ncbi:ABC-F family ATP-binding cassette domain-containing protein [uncultured Negativibacillus sp.]|uniref:ABC transporter ATP-binding protein n=1 Tax=uncultured Negativibacillus sp. TaxID=1980696 RepID=UPI0025CE804B|nr:ABC-F family ATP-binding cassette domain-containing protein [uncultured Negativibacillus sp.]
MIVSLENVFKYYGADCILRDVSATINEKDRIGLVGPNGEGKTTLLNVLTGGLDYEEGSVSVTNGKVIGYLKQNSGLSNGKTIQQEMEAVFADLIALGKEVDALQKQMAQVHDDPQTYEQVSAEYQKKLARFEARDGYHIDVKINTILGGMGFANYDRNIITDNLSGGEKTRLAIARLLLLEPDLLILDEPTNHLDFKTLGWLEDYLSSYKGAILVVSHDRYFLNRLVDHIWELERTVLTCFRGNYSSYVVQKKERVERQLKEYEQQQEQIKSMEEFVAKNIARASTSKSAKSRLAALERMDRIEKPVIWEKKAAFQFDYDEPPVKDVFHGKNMSIAVGEGDNRKVLCRNMQLDILRGEKIAIIGQNGVGKSSLLKAIQNLIPLAEGSFEWGQKVKTTYYEQENRQLHPEKTAINEIWDRFPNMYEVEVRNILGRVLLSGDDVYKQVGSLSGGERAKVAFAVMMLERGNVLILDEPTNHLDIGSKEMLEDALESFDGTILMVSHDRYLLNRIPTKIIEMSSDGYEVYNGRYDYYLEHKVEVQPKKVEATEEKKAATQKFYRTKADRARQVAVKKRIALLEKTIEQNEQTIEELTAQMADPAIAADYQKVEEICQQIEQLKNDNDAFSEEWLELSEEESEQ